MSYRTDRTASEIQKCVSVIMRTELRNPDISPLAVITGATVSWWRQVPTFLLLFKKGCKGRNLVNKA